MIDHPVTGHTPPWFRKVEVGAVVVFWGLAALLAVKLGPPLAGQPWLLLATAAAGFVLADLASGVIHSAADTWGSVDMPVIGPAILRPFREHHLDPKEMTRHDYVETNGASCLAAVPGCVVALLAPVGEDGWRLWSLGSVATLGWTIFFTKMTNQIHQWAHREPAEVWPVIRWAQAVHLILPPEHHRRHHTPPFETHYCITTGWLNAPLQRVRFFRGLERVVTALTGAQPRRSQATGPVESAGG